MHCHSAHRPNLVIAILLIELPVGFYYAMCLKTVVLSCVNLVLNDALCNYFISNELVKNLGYTFVAGAATMRCYRQTVP